MIFFNKWLEINIYIKNLFNREVYFLKQYYVLMTKKSLITSFEFFHKKMISPHIGFLEGGQGVHALPPKQYLKNVCIFTIV